MALFRWIEEKHLDVPEEDGSKAFLMFAQQGIGLYSIVFSLIETGPPPRVVEDQPLQSPER